MNDAQRYRMNAAECLSAAERSEPTYRDLTFAIAEAWLSLARQQQAIDELVGIWGRALSTTSTVIKPAVSSISSRPSPPPTPRARSPRRVGSQLGCAGPMALPRPLKFGSAQ
jgi:hypothetical protein